jgi:ATP-dependent helicase/nuclease subunit B
MLVEELVELAGVLTEWALQYGFNPTEAEVRFGLPDSRLPGWTLDLDEDHRLVLRGVIDRVDLCLIQEEGTALVAVQDYKSTVRPLQPRKLAGGLQLQLLSYLGALRGIHDAPALFGVRHIIPAGVFYIPLRAAAFPAGGRAEALANGASERRNSLVHQGRFDARWRAEFDRRSHATQGDQFRYKLTKEGKLARRGSDGLPPDEFARLLDENEEHLRRIGRAIFEGDAAVAPYRLGSECACDRCDYRPICRFDPWVQPYRKLPAPKPPSDEATRAERKEQTG